MIVVGIDEVGRGCWAGPLVAGAVVLDTEIVGLKDSKKLSKLQREKLAILIEQSAKIGLGWVQPAEIDELGLTKAVGLAMQRAFMALECVCDEIIIDGNINYFPNDVRAKAIIRADDLIPVVSAASIVAKVARDTYMVDIAQKYPEYGFDQHVGYGTLTHRAALKAYGITDIHRKSYKPIKMYSTLT